MNLKSTVLTAAGATMCINATALAQPPIWESNYGIELTDLTNRDDRTQEVTLSFDFDYAGGLYNNIFVGTNGAVALDGLGETNDYPSDGEFWETPDPMLAVLWSDMDLSQIGTIYLNDFGDRAVVTWDGIGSYESSTSPNTFQLQIFDDGKIIFGYNGIQENNNNFDVDIHIGLTEGNSPSELNVDYTNGDFTTANSTILESFEYDDEFFDLDGQNIIFTPNAAGGYSVSTIPTPGAASILALSGLIASRRRRN